MKSKGLFVSLTCYGRLNTLTEIYEVITFNVYQVLNDVNICPLIKSVFFLFNFTRLVKSYSCVKIQLKWWSAGGTFHQNFLTCNVLTVITRHILSVNWDDLTFDVRWRPKSAGDNQAIYTYTACRVTKWLVNIRVTIRRGFFRICPLFRISELCPWGFFLILPNIRFFGLCK
jgi:hypothetical protein